MFAVAWKRLHLNLISARFWIGFALAFSLGLLSLLAGLGDYQSAWSLYQTQKQADDPSAASRQWITYSQVELTFHSPPSAWSLVAKGLGERGGAAANMYGDRGRPFLFSRARFNFLLPSLQGIDFSFLVLAVLALMAIFLSADLLVEERDAGTMQLTLIGHISRFQLLLGEWLGTLITLLIPVLLLTLMAGLFLLFSGAAVLGSDAAIRLGMFLLVQILAVSSFVGIGLLISARCADGGTALAAGFFAWVVLIAIYPNAAVWVARQAVPLNPIVTLEDDNTLTRMTSFSQDTSREREWQEREAFDLANRHRARLIESAWLATPFCNALIANQDIAGTGLQAHTNFVRQVRRIQQQLSSWKEQKLLKYPERASFYNPSWPPLDVSGLPLPENAVRDWHAAVQALPLPVAILLFWNLLCFVLTQYSFAIVEVAL